MGRALSVSEIIAPTFRSRLGQPSSRFPIPGANELSTVEWQEAQVIPTEVRLPDVLKFAFTPTTAFNFKSASVVAVMKEWVEVPAEHASRWVELAREALRYVDEARKRT